MTNKRRFNKRNRQRNSRYTPPSRTIDTYSYADYRHVLFRNNLGSPNLAVCNFSMKATPEDMAGALALFVAGENTEASSHLIEISSSGVEVHPFLEARYKTKAGLAHLMYSGTATHISMTIGYTNEQELEDHFAISARTNSNVSRRRGDSDWFNSVSPLATLRESMDIAARHGLDMPSGLEMDEYCVELIRKRWNFRSNTSFVEAVEQGMNDARRITSRR